ncbi:MAG TPA: glycoside hydrolase family 15 protein [Pyrinomonadaceae bacterium]|nr:glycoside hydrolase family 15 protein [Pyrinomonadaceae bacterium]
MRPEAGRTETDRTGYRPIGDYALIGDAHTAALVARDGSIDWCCWPRFDSPAVFCRLLDARQGGWFRVGPAAAHTATRSYIQTTNVLTTTFETDEGKFRLTDFMPVTRLTDSHRGEDIAPGYMILRLVEGLAGTGDVEVSFRPTFNYALAETLLTPHEHGALAHAGREGLGLSCPVRLQADDSGALTGRLTVRPHERIWISLTYYPDTGRQEITVAPASYDAELERTLGYWREWWHTCRYDGQYTELVRRSALTLKLLTFEPTGALVAAATTSLPEQIGGVRNWDYRYTWLRDSSLILYALQLLGYTEEATDFFEWLDSLCITCRGKLQIMYTIDGRSEIPEHTLEHLEGYRRSRPVRIGNAAFEQKQLDIYGEVLDAVHLYHTRTNSAVRQEWWDEVKFMAEQTVERWREPDYGIWEVRGGARQFLYSKLMCWVALDRAVKLAEHAHAEAEVRRWSRAREEIRRAILTEGYNKEVGAFTQAFGEPHLDASALVIPLSGFLPASDPRVLSTVERVQERLTSNGLVYRYLTDDGLPGGEATFALCSFWLVDNLAMQGRAEEARALFEKIVGYANDLGLLAEEIDPVSGELLGNYPQGFSHLALIRSALNISKCEAAGSETQAATSAERAEETERTVQLH